MSFTVDEVAAVTKLQPSVIRYLVTVILRQDVQAITAESLMAILAFDMLKLYGFSTEDCSAIISQFAPRIFEVGRSCQNAVPGDQLELVTLTIYDGRLAAVGEELFDFKTMAVSSSAPLPTTFAGIALPRLYQRALLAVESLRGSRAEGSGS